MSKSDCLPSTFNVLIYCLDKIWDYHILLSKTNKMISFNPVYVYIWGYLEAVCLKLLFLPSKTLWNFFLLSKIIVTRCQMSPYRSILYVFKTWAKQENIPNKYFQCRNCNKEFWLDLLKGDDGILNQLLILWKGNITGVYFLHKCVIKLNIFIY